MHVTPSRVQYRRVISTIVQAHTVPCAVERLYAGFASRNPLMLASALHERFTLFASAGMPLGVGGRHDGAERAITDVWGHVNGAYDIAPLPSRMWTTPEGVIVVHGWYRGVVRRSCEPVDAEFVHLLQVEDGLVVELRQITDTAAWGCP